MRLKRVLSVVPALVFLGFLVSSTFVYAGILDDAMNAVEGLVSGVQGLLSAVASILIFFVTYKIIKKALGRA
jgi:hypothetical protein